MKKNEIRSYIMTRAWLGIEGRMIHSELVLRLGGQAPSIRTVFRSIELSQTRRELVVDIYRIGRPRTATSQANITRVDRVNDALFHCISKNLMALSQANKVDGRSA